MPHMRALSYPARSFMCVRIHTHAHKHTLKHVVGRVVRHTRSHARSTGRKRRCGWLDTVVLKYTHTLNNFNSINITKLDVLDDIPELQIGVAYKINGKLLPPGAMPSTIDDLAEVEVVYESACHARLRWWQ